MKNIIILLSIFLSTFALAQEAPIEKCECPFDKSKIEAEEIWCGKLTVPENHKQPDGRKIRIMFTIIKPKNATNDPVVLLPGGPGIAPVQSSYLRIIKNWIPDDRTFVVFDPRGTGLSGPEMCPELNETYASIAALDLSFEEAQKMRLGADLACRDRLVREGIDLTQYSNDAIARDVNALMQSLGYDKYNLLGGSAGVSMVRSSMHLYPQNIRSAVFNNGPGIDLTEMFTYDVPNVERAFRHMIALCENDEDCRNKYPNLEQDFFEIYKSLKQKPITVEVNEEQFTNSSFTLNSQDFVVILERLLVREPSVRNLPAIINAVKQNDRDVIHKLIENHYGGLNSSFNIGMGNSVLCNGSYTSNAHAEWEKVANESEAAFRELNYWLLPCDYWVKEYDPEETKKPFKSDIPSLVLTGEYDPTTTERETKTHLPYFSHFQYYIIPGMAHGPPGPREADCWIDLIKQFITNPDQKINADCLEKIPPAGVETELPDWLKNK